MTHHDDDRKIDYSYLFEPTNERQFDAQIDREAIIEDDGRSDSETFFYPDENVDSLSDSRRQQYERMSRWNAGVNVNNGDRRSKNRSVDRKKVLMTFGSQVELTKYQKSRSLYLLKGLKLNAFGHYSAEQVILGIMAYVAREDGRFLRDEPEFQTLIKTVGLTGRNLKSIMDMLKQPSKWADGTCLL